MGIHRSERLKHRQLGAIATKTVNAKRKAAERKRRDERMLAEVRGGSLPFSHDVMSWLSRRLGKPSGKITQADINGLT